MNYELWKIMLKVKELDKLDLDLLNNFITGGREFKPESTIRIRLNSVDDIKSSSYVNSRGKEIIADEPLVCSSYTYQFDFIPKNRMEELYKINQNYADALSAFENSL